MLESLYLPVVPQAKAYILWLLAWLSTYCLQQAQQWLVRETGKAGLYQSLQNTTEITLNLHIYWDYIVKTKRSEVIIATSKSIRGRLYEVRIAYSADKALKHDRLIQAFNNRTLILSAE